MKMSILYHITFVIFLCSPQFTLPCPDASKIIYYIFSYKTLSFSKITNISEITFDSNINSIFISHGYNQNSSSPWVINMAIEFTKKDLFNIFAIDWSQITSYNTNNDSSLINLFYPLPASETCCAGNIVGKYLMDLNQILNLNYTKTHLVGHSLGAHLSGCTGQYIQNNTNNKLGRISGLDPAGPGFNNINKDWRISPDDADFVDCIHTDRLGLGYYEPLGTVDFFVNCGYLQPYCLTDLAGIGIPFTYNHRFVQLLYIATINNYGFIAKQCSNCVDYITTNNFCSNDTQAEMGYNVNKNATGSYYIRTTGCPPYIIQN